MSMKAVQQIMLGTVCKNEAQALETLNAIKAAGYDGIELNGFMIRPTSFLVRALTKAAGMPTGKGGNFNWVELTKAAGLQVVSLHEDLGSYTVSVLPARERFSTMDECFHRHLYICHYHGYVGADYYDCGTEKNNFQG